VSRTSQFANAAVFGEDDESSDGISGDAPNQRRTGYQRIQETLNRHRSPAAPLLPPTPPATPKRKRNSKPKAKKKPLSTLGKPPTPALQSASSAA
jgi:hypothetical protein